MIHTIKRFSNIFPKKQFGKFFLVGALGMFINLTSLYLFVDFLDMYYIFGATFSFILSITNNFLFNKKWTFENNDTQYRKLYGKYVIISILSMVIGLGLLKLIVESFGTWYLLAQFFAVMAAGINSFLWVKYWVFRSNEPTNN